MIYFILVYVKVIKIECETGERDAPCLPLFAWISSFSVVLLSFSPLCSFCLLDLRGDVTRVATRLHRASVAGGRSQSGVNPVDRHGDTGIRQRERVVLIFRISLWPRGLSSLFFSCPFFEIVLLRWRRVRERNNSCWGTFSFLSSESFTCLEFTFYQ